MATVDGAVVTFVSLLILLVHRQLMRRYWVQSYVHLEHPKARMLLQYYALLYVFLLCSLVESFVTLVHQDFSILTGIESIKDILNTTMHREDVRLGEKDILDWEESLRMSGFLRYLSLFTPIAAMATCVLAGIHVLRVLEHSVHHTGLYWFPTYRQDLVLQVVLLPPLYAVLAFRSVVRMWGLAVGDGWAELALEWRWEDYVAREMLHFKANLAVADFAEMYTVWCFGCLCVDLLKDSVGTRKLSYSFSNVVMQGIYSFILAGLLQVGVIVCGSAMLPLGPQMVNAMRAPSVHVVREADNRVKQVAWDRIHFEASSAAAVQMVARMLLVIASVQAIVNMYQVCRLPELQRINPQSKFLGTRILVIVAQLQYALLESGRKILPFIRWYSNFQVNVLHASLLTYECFLVACLHLWSWPREDYVDGRLPLGDADSVVSSDEEISSPGPRDASWMAALNASETSRDSSSWSALGGKTFQRMRARSADAPRMAATTLRNMASLGTPKFTSPGPAPRRFEEHIAAARGRAPTPSTPSGAATSSSAGPSPTNRTLEDYIAAAQERVAASAKSAGAAAAAAGSRSPAFRTREENKAERDRGLVRGSSKQSGTASATSSTSFCKRNMEELPVRDRSTLAGLGAAGSSTLAPSPRTLEESSHSLAAQDQTPRGAASTPRKAGTSMRVPSLGIPKFRKSMPPGMGRRVDSAPGDLHAGGMTTPQAGGGKGFSLQQPLLQEEKVNGFQGAPPGSQQACCSVM